MWCWGTNRNGELGNGVAGGTGAFEPAQIVDASGKTFGPVKLLQVAASSACAVTEKDRALWCWGYGQKPAPTQVLRENVAVTGVHHLGEDDCYVDATGRTYVSGRLDTNVRCASQ